MFFRIKAALITALVVAAVTIAAAAYVASSLRARTVSSVEEDVVRAEKVLLSHSRLEGLDLGNLAASFAREDQFVQIFARPNLEEQEKAAYVEVEVRKARIEKKPDGDDRPEATKVGIIGVVDAKGSLLARDLQPAWRRGDVLTGEFPSLELALKGIANKDIWNLEGAMYRVGAAPIKGPQGNVLGAVFVGFVQSTTDANAAAQLLGCEVAYFLDGKIHASSFEHREGTSETTEEKALAGQLFDGPRLAEQAMSARQASAAFHVQIGRDEWVAAAAPIPGNATASRSGFVVLKSLRTAEAQIAPLAGLILALGLVSILMVVGAWQMTERRFLVPLDRLEAGVSEVINGNQDYVFESPSEDFEGLANGLNVMLARLLGHPEPGDDDDSGDRGEGSLSQMQ